MQGAEFVVIQVLPWILGGLGLFGLGALPLRAYALAREAWRTTAKVRALLIVALALLASALAAPFVWGLCRCLWGEGCSATRAGGWLNAMFMGALYLGFELAAWLLCRLWRIRTRVQAAA